MDKATAQQGWNALAIDSPDQHSTENLDAIERTLRMGVVDSESAIPLALRMVSHVHPRAQAYIEELAPKIEDQRVRELLSMESRAWQNMRFRYYMERLDPQNLQNFYRTTGPGFVKRPDTKKLLVLFTTHNNSFGFSNAAMSAMLGNSGCSVLILRDPSRAMYLLGVPGFAIGFDRIGRSISRLARQEGFEEIYIAGTSLTGYTALKVALSMECNGFLGFNAPTNMAVQRMDTDPTDPDQPAHLDDYIDPGMFGDLKPELEERDKAMPVTLYFGEASDAHKAQATRVAGTEGVKVIGVPEVGEGAIRKLMSDRKLLPAFENLLSGN